MKLGQNNGGNAALLLLVITAIVLIYIILLPDAERDDLIDTNSNSSSNTSNSGKLLFNATPGLLLHEDDDNVRHDAGSVSVFVRSDEVELADLRRFIVSSSSGGQERKVVNLSAEGVVRNAQLTFTVVDGSGRLFVSVDGEEVFSGVPRNQVSPISLEDLSSNSVIVFETESISGWQFWRSNHYEIADLKVTATHDSFDSQQAITSFVVSSDELARVESASISYFTSCASGIRSGQLQLSLNGRVLFSGFPDCNSPAKIELLASDLIAGRNQLTFSTTTGSYLLDRITITTIIEEALPASYFFTIDDNEYDRIESESDEVKVYFSFIDNNERKSAELNINNVKFSIDTKGKNFTQTIPASAIREDSNALTITPRRTFALPLIEVRLD